MLAVADPNAPWGAVTAIFTGLLVIGVGVAGWAVKRVAEGSGSDPGRSHRGFGSSRPAAGGSAGTATSRASFQPLLIEVLRFGPVTPDMEASSGQSLRAAQMPLLTSIDVGDVQRMMLDPRQVYVDLSSEKGVISIPLRNVGRGLAVVSDRLISVDGPIGNISDVIVDRPRVPPTRRPGSRFSVAPKRTRASLPASRSRSPTRTSPTNS